MGSLRLRADLHIHSCLSPCADLGMSPGRIAAAARARGVEALALTDHNASLNCPAFAIACAREGIVPLFGLELCSLEEVHLLAIFATPREALEFGAAVYALLPELPWDPAAFGDQVAVDEEENVVAMPERWLGAALESPFGELASRARAAGALVIPAHVDRGMFSVYSQLGFLPPGPYDAVESMWKPVPSLTGGLAAVSGSDAHYPEHVGRRPFAVTIASEAFEALKGALAAYAEAFAAAPAPAADAGGAAGGSAGGGYALLLDDRRLRLYPEAEARRFLEALREGLRGGAVEPTHPPRPASAP